MLKKKNQAQKHIFNCVLLYQRPLTAGLLSNDFGYATTIKRPPEYKNSLWIIICILHFVVCVVQQIRQHENYPQRLRYRFESTGCSKNIISKFCWGQGIFFFQKEIKIDVKTPPSSFYSDPIAPVISIAFIPEIISVTPSQLIYSFKLKTFNGLL